MMNKQFVYRVYTAFNHGLLIQTRRYFDGATLIPDVYGLFRGQLENATIIEIIVPVRADDRVTELIADIKRENGQSSVLVTVGEVEVFAE